MSTEKTYFKGNVGIGVQDPEQALQVIGDISAGHFWEGGNNNTGVKIGKPDEAGKWYAGSAFLQFQDSKEDGVNKGTSLSVHTHQWGAGTKETFRIAANGNVGIGQPNPGHKLDVDGMINAKDVLINGQPIISIIHESVSHMPGFPSAPTGSSDTLAIGLPAVHPNFKLQAHGGSGAWKGGIASGGDEAAVAMGELQGKATIGGHSSKLDAWADLILNPDSGNVGIGVKDPSQKLEVSGNILCHGTLAQNSDGRLKKAIRPITRALDKVTKLRGVNYLWKDAIRGNNTQLGLIAQEVEAVLPEAVCTDFEGNKSITYSNLTAVLIEAIKELSDKLARLESKATT